MDEMLSTVSSARDLGSKFGGKNQYQFPIPKNRDLGKFMADVSETESKPGRFLSGDRNKRSGDTDKRYGETKNKYQNITKLLHHDYLAQYSDYAKDKSERMQRQNKEKVRQSRDWKNFKWNKAQKERFNIIQQRYFSPETRSSKMEDFEKSRNTNRMQNYQTNVHQSLHKLPKLKLGTKNELRNSVSGKIPRNTKN